MTNRNLRICGKHRALIQNNVSLEVFGFGRGIRRTNQTAGETVEIGDVDLKDYSSPAFAIHEAGLLRCLGPSCRHGDWDVGLDVPGRMECD